MAAMQYTIAGDGSAPVPDKMTNEELSTTEEETDSAIEDGPATSESGSSITEEVHEVQYVPATVEEQQDAFRQYAERFGQDRSGNRHHVFDRASFGCTTPNQKEADARPDHEVLVELDRDLAVSSPCPTLCEKEQLDDAELAAKVPISSTDDGLLLTFGYAGTLGENPPFALFDIRDEVCMKTGGFRHGQIVRTCNGEELVVVGVKKANGSNRLFFHPISLGRPGAGAFCTESKERQDAQSSCVVPALELLEARETPHFHELRPEDFDAAEESDSEEVRFCCHCRLPVGEAYVYGSSNKIVHAECLAQLMLADFEKEEESTKQTDAARKRSDRERYGIGWRPEEIPENMMPAVRLGCAEVPQGMCGLRFDEASHTVEVVPTLEPAASINLEYLSIALQVRAAEGREPLFSLDPVDPQNELQKESMQEKRFEPEWLAGTSVGEIMFQADYHLKELSMGEYTQPVVGMKSCFDYSGTGDFSTEWFAREWFIVRKAEIGITEENILVPKVKMGVEAREQALQGQELVDMKSTRPQHPMVKFAESFTRYFDLIAERKSSIFHLRELAKASALAKMLVDAAVNLHGPWLDVAGEPNEASVMEVPQLWVERERQRISIRDGKTANEPNTQVSGARQRCGIYGGVNFGLERRGVAMPSAIAQSRIGKLTAPRLGLAQPRVMLSAPSAPGIARPGASLTASSGPTGRLAGRTAGLSGVALTRPAPVVASAAAAMPHLTSASAGFAMPPQTLGGKLVAAPGVLTAPRPAGALKRGMPGALGQVPQATFASMKLTPVTPDVLIPGRPAVGLTALRSPTSLALPSMAAKLARSGLKPVSAAPTLSTQLRPSLGITAAGLIAPIMPVDPRGVDLNLDQFNLSKPVAMEGHAWDAAQNVKCASMSSTFWRCIDDSDAQTAFQAADHKLLQAVFNRNLCDRREEGDRFIPPDTSFDYVSRLRDLVREEETCRELRIDRFLSKDFSCSSPGDLFPRSWVPSSELTKCGKFEDVLKVSARRGELHPRPEYISQAHKFENVLKSTNPTFDKTTEEKLRFRIYHLGNLEVRTTQVPAGEEVVGAVFSISAPKKAESAPSQPANERDKIVKVTEYVEKVPGGYRSFVVFETDRGCTICTEKLADGTATWEENPIDLEDRTYFAKVIRCKECKSCVTVRFMRNYQNKENLGDNPTSISKCKQYAQGAYMRAVGETMGREYSGFFRDKDAGKWQLNGDLLGIQGPKGAIAADELQASMRTDGERPGLGDMVRVKRTGRAGEITVDDGSEMPYKVSFDDGEIPRTKWFKETDLQRSADPKP